MEPAAGGPVPWLYGIAANLVRRHIRGVGRQRAAVARLPLLLDEPDPSDGIAGRLDNARRVRRTLEALASMPDDDQELFVLCVWQELSYGEAAAALGIPVGTVRSRLSRARTRLRLALGEPTGGSGDEPGAAPSGDRKAGSL
jgi:RNA polymerase sigma-70 factor (ECF subfamily)